MRRIFGLIFLASVGSCVKLPSNFQKCNRKDPGLKECILKAAQHGIPQLDRAYPELNIPNISPYQLSEVTIPGSGVVAVDQKFKNCSLYGLTGITFEQFEFDFEKEKLEIKGVFSEIAFKCMYELDGKILLLPIKGNGQSEVDLKNLRVSALFNFKKFTKRSKTFLEFLSGDLVLDPELVTYNFENLFDGNKQLGDSINKVLNDSWKEVFDDVKEGYSEFIKRIVLHLLSKFFAKMSLEEALD